MSEHRSRRRGPRKDPRTRKDRLIQTRVAGDLEETLKREAGRRRLSVSHLIRNVLEDSFHLVDTVVTEVDHIVQDSVELAQQVREDVRDLSRPPGRQARRSAPPVAAPATRGDGGGASAPAAAQAAAADAQASTGTQPPVPPVTPEAPLPPAPAPAPGPATPEVDPLGHIYAWNPVVLNRAARCVKCDAVLERGETGHLGLTQEPGSPPTWLCGDCLATL